MKTRRRLVLKHKKIVRNEKKFNLEFERARLSIEIPVATKENFKQAVEKYGKTMKEVLEAYMRRYTIRVLQKEEKRFKKKVKKIKRSESSQE
ncbi:hypothetical protein QNH49_22555 [Bacillus bombysepticus]|nr:hypothetical protein QNH49_22555 [Bacillus bombysepticus]